MFSNPSFGQLFPSKFLCFLGQRCSFCTLFSCHLTSVPGPWLLTCFSQFEGGKHAFLAQFSPVQDGIHGLRKARCASPISKKVSLTFPFKQFQRSPDWRRPFSILSRKIIECLIFPGLSPPGHQWYDVFGFDPTGSVSSSSTLQFFLGIMQTTCDGYFAHQSVNSIISHDSSMPVTVPLQESSKTSVKHWHMHASLGIPFHFSFFSIVLNTCNDAYLTKSWSFVGLVSKARRSNYEHVHESMGYFDEYMPSFCVAVCFVFIVIIINLLSLVSVCPAGCLSKWAKWLQQLWEQLFCCFRSVVCWY